MSFLTQIIAALLGGSTLAGATRSSSRSSGMPKMLFGVLVSLASVVGWQVIQKYKNTPLGKPLENIAKNIGLTDGTGNFPSMSTNVGQPVLNSNYPRTATQPTNYGNNNYASNQYPQQGYNQQRPATYPQSQPQPYNQYPNNQYSAQQPQPIYTGYPQPYSAQSTQYPAQTTHYPQTNPQYPAQPNAQFPTQPNTAYGQQPYPQYSSQYPTVPTASIPYGNTGGLQPINPTTSGMQPIPYPNNTGYGNGTNSNGTNHYNGYPTNTNPYPSGTNYNTNYNPGVQQPSNNPLTTVTNSYGQYTGTANQGSGTIKIGSFNIQVFGKSKLEERDPAVMQTITSLVSRYDVVAIQELRAKEDTIIPQFMQMLNSSTGKRFDSLVGPRLGRTSSKEQYVYIFNTETIEIDRTASYTAKNPGERLHRAPLVACFRAKQAPPNQAYTFTLVNIHTDPDDVPNELNALVSVIDAVKNDGRREDDIILLGDLNAGDINENNRHLDPLVRYGMTPIVSGHPTMTKANRANDNMLVFRNDTAEFTGSWGVIDYASEFRLSEAQALNISDHRPIWAEFSIYEKNNSQMVRQGNQVMPMSYMK